MPNHKVIAPVNPIDISNPVLAESNVPFIIWVKTSKSPKNKSLMHAMIKAITKNAIHI
jgi:hypothetical protein